jgi:sarcosine oxidase subunit alpha
MFKWTNPGRTVHRLTQLPTLRIDPSEDRSFIYRGRRYAGLKGDTVATGLYANGIRIFSRSIKYHRPRGLYSLDGESSNCLMEINGVPNVQAERTLLKNGMRVRPQNVVGSPERDLMGFMDKLDWAMPAGFYYRYFYRPYGLWPFFRERIRRVAGLGVVHPDSRMTGRFDEQYIHSEVCVIGGGPAGMSAALAAARQGLRVSLLEARPWLGGVFDYRGAEYGPGVPLYERARDLAREMRKYPNARVFAHTFMVGLYDDNLITSFQVGGSDRHFDQRYLEIRAGSVVVATGCTERPLIFENNDRPGVMQIGCVHRLCRTYGLLAGECAVFSISTDPGLEAAVDLFDLGLGVLYVADSRTSGQDPALLEALAQRKISFFPGWVALKAHGKTLHRVTLGAVVGSRRLQVDCDILVASAGLTPAAAPLYLAQAEMRYDKRSCAFLPWRLPPKVHAAGRLLGYEDPFAIEVSGELAGLEAAIDCGAPAGALIKRAAERIADLPGPATGSSPPLPAARGQKRFICFDEDTTLKHIHQACDMGFDRVELAKRFTGAGTGPAQGGIPGDNLPLALAHCLGRPSDPEPPSTVRAPLVPTLLATYAGARHEMFKRTPVHEPQQKLGAIFRRIGTWKRARYFSRDFSSRREIEGVRNNVGMIDVSTLGKFRIFGPDALRALQRVYVGDMAAIQEGRVKYSVMCNHDGSPIDDGVIAKQGENDYFFTTTTARADVTVEWIGYHTRYDQWDFHLVNLTDAYGVINLAGPNARRVLERLTDADISREGFPYGGYQVMKIGGVVPAKVMRLGFLGELSYEIHVPASYMEAVWDLVLEAGKDFDIGPFGLEAQNVLRLEKGRIILGQESEIRTTLHDLGLGFLWHRDKVGARTVGAHALRFTEHQENRMKLVGIETEDPLRPPKDGAIVVDQTVRGYVCTGRYSFTLKKSIGLALVEEPLRRTGTRLAVFEEGMKHRRLYVRVVATPFYDPEGIRLKM